MKPVFIVCIFVFLNRIFRSKHAVRSRLVTREERKGSCSVDRGNDRMANPGSSSQSPAGPTPREAPPVASFIPVPPRLEMKNYGPNPTTWCVWAQRWKAFAAVSRLDAWSDEYQCGMLTSAVDDETLRIIDALPYLSEPDRKSRRRSSTCSENAVHRTKTLSSNATRSPNDGKRKGKPSNSSLQNCVRWPGRVTSTKPGRISLEI